MNSRQRIMAAIRHEKPDRVPCSPHMGVGLAQKMPPAEWQALLHETDVTVNVGMFGDAEIFGGQYWREHRRIAKEGDTTTVEVETPKGILRSRSVATPQASWTAEHIFKGTEDVEKALSIPYTPLQIDATHYHEWVKEIGDEGLVALGSPSAFRFCYGGFGSQAMYEIMADDPDLVEKVIALTAERLEIYVRDCCRQGIKSFWMGGSEHCGPGVVNPKLFRRMVKPYDQRIVRVMHEHGAIVNYHQHAKLKDILDDIAEIGVDVLSPVETGLRGDVTLASAKARIGDRVCLKGNLDDMAFLAIEPAETVREAAEECIRQAAAGSGYVLSGTDAGIYSPEWVQSFLVMAEVAKAHPY
jgi:hypothetical protein